MDERIKSRNSEFSSENNQKNYREKKERRAVELRKSKRSLEVNKKREIPSEIPQIVIDKLKIQELLTSRAPVCQGLGLKYFQNFLFCESNSQFLSVCIDPIFDLVVKGTESLRVLSLLTFVYVSKTDFADLLTEKIEDLFKILENSSEVCKENILQILGNLFLHNEKCRKTILSYNLIEISLQIINSTQNLLIYSKISWLISISIEFYDDYYAFQAFPIINLSFTHNFTSIYTESLWALVHLSKSRQNLSILQSILPEIRKFCKISIKSLQIPALRILGNILNGSEDETAQILSKSLIKTLITCLESQCKEIRTETVWVFSNLCAGKSVKLVVELGIFKRIIDLSITDCKQVQNEAAWAFYNAILICDAEILQKIVDHGVLSAMCCLLSVAELKTKNLMLKSMRKLLQRGEIDGNNIFVNVLEGNGGIETLESLVFEKNKKISEKATRILKEFGELSNS